MDKNETRRKVLPSVLLLVNGGALFALGINFLDSVSQTFGSVFIVIGLLLVIIGAILQRQIHDYLDKD